MILLDGNLAYALGVFLSLRYPVVNGAVAPHGPENPGEFSCEGDDGDFRPAGLAEVVGPLAKRVVDVAHAQDAPRGLNQHRPCDAVALFRDTPEAALRWT